MAPTLLQAVDISPLNSGNGLNLGHLQLVWYGNRTYRGRFPQICPPNLIAVAGLTGAAPINIKATPLHRHCQSQLTQRLLRRVHCALVSSKNQVLDVR